MEILLALSLTKVRHPRIAVYIDSDENGFSTDETVYPGKTGVLYNF
jgi:hypothetical protein